VFFFILEMMILYKEGFKDYIQDISNIPDLIQFITHTIFFVLKIIQWNREESTNADDIKFEADIGNTLVIMSSLIMFSGVIKAQHIIKISPIGLLTELFVRSLKGVIPFMIIFTWYVSLFAFELFILKSNGDNAKEFGAGMPTEGLNYMLGYWIQAF